MELAKITDLKIYNVDINPASVRQCNLLVEQNKLSGRVLALEADATNLPLRDNFTDMVVSRNSLTSPALSASAGNSIRPSDTSQLREL